MFPIDLRATMKTLGEKTGKKVIKCASCRHTEFGAMNTGTIVPVSPIESIPALVTYCTHCGRIVLYAAAVLGVTMEPPNIIEEQQDMLAARRKIVLPGS